MTESEVVFISHVDRHVSFDYPDYFECQRDPNCLSFLLLPKGRKRSGKESVVIAILSSSRSNFELDVANRMSKPPLGREFDDGAVRRCVIRSGRCSSLENAEESVESFSAYRAGFEGYFWMIHLFFDGGIVEVKIHKDGNFLADEAIWTRMLKSIRVYQAELAPEECASIPSVARQRVSPLVRKALESLPPELQYLKASILDLSTQSSDDVASGEADLALVDAAIDERAAGMSSIELKRALQDDYDQLDSWTKSQLKRNSKAALAAAAVAGALIGKLTYET